MIQNTTYYIYFCKKKILNSLEISYNLAYNIIEVVWGYYL